jgi:tetratricopeptide (TPR) repeat protein
VPRRREDDVAVLPPEGDGSGRRGGSPAESAILALPGLLLVALFLLWAAGEGGLAPTVWYPGALFSLALLVVLAALAGRLVSRPSRWTLAALGLLAGFAAWSFLSITWADVRADAWDGANRSLLYLIVFALFALWPWTPRRAALVLGAFALGAAGLGAFSLVRAVGAAEPEGFFIDARFVGPLGYANAESAFFLIAFWPALFLASRREVPFLARGLMLGAAGVLLELAVLPQSRGSVFSFPLALALYFLLVPGRLRSAVALVPIAAAALLSRERLLDVYALVDAGGDPATALAPARDAVAVSFAALVLVGVALALADRRLDIGERRTRIAARAAGVLAVVAAVAGIAAVVLAVGDPVPRVEREWDEFKAGYQPTDGESRFSRGVGSNRYDFWRVALGEFKEHPVVGIGADNFAVAYVQERSSPEETRYPHSLQVMALSQTGLVGAALLGGFLACALASAYRRASRQEGFGRALTAVGVVAFGYWFLHGSIDWFWELPALTAPALAFLGIAGAREAPGAGTDRRAGLLPRLALAGAAGLAALAAAVSFTLPWLAARDVERAIEIWRQDAEQAFELLERARGLNPLSDRPDSIAGAVASRREEWARMREAFSRALARNPTNWYTHLELALADSQLGRRQAALGELREAKALNPLEPIIDDVRTGLQNGEPIDPSEIDRRFVRRAEERLT